MPDISETCIPILPRRVKLVEDRARGRWVLNAPERVIAPDETALEILRLCDGDRSLGAICDLLAARYDAPRETIAADVLELLSDLADKRLLDLRPAP
jgi:pyrroloquinoline quinone biosynthesis protein D